MMTIVIYDLYFSRAKNTYILIFHFAEKIVLSFILKWFFYFYSVIYFLEFHKFLKVFLAFFKRLAYTLNLVSSYGIRYPELRTLICLCLPFKPFVIITTPIQIPELELRYRTEPIIYKDNFRLTALLSEPYYELVCQEFILLKWEGPLILFLYIV